MKIDTASHDVPRTSARKDAASNFKERYGVHSQAFETAILKRAKAIRSAQKLLNFIEVLSSDSPTCQNLAVKVRAIGKPNNNAAPVKAKMQSSTPSNFRTVVVRHRILADED